MEVTRIEHFLRKALDYMEHTPVERIDRMYLWGLVNHAIQEVEALETNPNPGMINTDVCWETKSVIDIAERDEKKRGVL